MGYICKKFDDMGTYTIEINERTKEGRLLKQLLDTLGSVKLKPSRAQGLGSISLTRNKEFSEITQGLNEVMAMQQGKKQEKTLEEFIDANR